MHAAGAVTRGRSYSAGLIVGALILLGQVGVAIWQHLGPTRYFAWAPNDYTVTYDVQASVAGRALTPGEIARRYRLDLTDRLGEVPESVKRKVQFAPTERYVWEDPPQHLLDRFQWYEERYDPRNPAHIVVTYQVDAGPVKVWRWPR